jgi:hypothetical protein
VAITEEAVRAIIPTELTDLTAHIATAEAMLALCAEVLALPQPQQDLIGTWLAAHAVAMTDPRHKSDRRLDYETEIEQGELGWGLQSTRYGQMALLLDPTGCLAKHDPNQAMQDGSASAALATKARIDLL